MGKGFVRVENFEPFDIPENKFLYGEELCSVSMPVQIDTEGQFVVNVQFPDLVGVLEERGAKRGEEYIICMRSTPYGHYIIGLCTFTNYLSKEDII